MYSILHFQMYSLYKKNANYAYSLITRAPLKIIIFNLQDT